MKSADDKYPCNAYLAPTKGKMATLPPEGDEKFEGIPRRDWLATKAMQAMAGLSVLSEAEDRYFAYKMADALIAECGEPKQ